MPDERPHETDVVLPDGERARVTRAGAPEAPVVLLIHGWGASAYNYRFVVPRLAAAGLSVVVPDLRGHGGSDKPADHARYSSSAMASFVAAVADTLAVRPAVVAGQSIGGAIAMDLAVTRPDLVPAAVLISSIGFAPLRRVDLARRARAWRWGHIRIRRWMVRLILARIYGDRRPWTEDDVDGYFEALRDPACSAALLALVREFDFGLRDPAPLARLGPRLRMLFGEQDGMVPYRVAVEHARRFAGAHVQLLAGVGHVPAEEAPDEVAAAIKPYATGP